MLRSLVGSEMCIRDRSMVDRLHKFNAGRNAENPKEQHRHHQQQQQETRVKDEQPRVKYEYDMNGRLVKVPLHPGDHPHLDAWSDKLSAEFGMTDCHDRDELEEPDPKDEMSIAERERQWKHQLKQDFKMKEAEMRHRVSPTHIPGFEQVQRSDRRSEELRFSHLEEMSTAPATPSTTVNLHNLMGNTAAVNQPPTSTREILQRTQRSSVSPTLKGAGKVKIEEREREDGTLDQESDDAHRAWAREVLRTKQPVNLSQENTSTLEDRLRQQWDNEPAAADQEQVGLTGKDMYQQWFSKQRPVG
eukprot:TRINITY_DN44046_c0_g1_i4.p1 TRINITY_DN44046_c0_g1~~TRINITY_DN44046_c0_g1_i4.p1  ORF type:complete len:303 (-),score=91.33 TRINITY_DN44046_c0_g1_i4:403-1311(-)